MARFPCVVAFFVLWFAPVFAAEIADPFEAPPGAVPATRIDEFVLQKLQEEGIQPARPCSDAVFIRRVYVDVAGTIPDPEEVREFLADEAPDKRAKLINRLLESEQFADYCSLKWCDVLRVKAEYPIKLWPNAVQAYHGWVRESIRQNRPYDEFVRALLTSTGSNFRVPPVNFYRAVQDRSPEGLAGAVALTFMGTRIQHWPESRRQGMAAFFSRVAYKPTAEWKEEIIYVDPAAAGPLEAAFPDGRGVTVPAGKDPRKVFADWLISEENPWFARAAVNRTWSWLMGCGIIHEPDDIREDNPAVNPELLAFLEKEFVASGYDMRHLWRLILSSRTYQQSSIARSDAPRVETLFAVYPVRPMDAEVLIDALCKITGNDEGYSSPIPEPFTWVPETHSTVALSDGSITSRFLELFGRPARDTGLESERNSNPTAAQRRHMLNSTHVHDKITRGPNLRRVLYGRADGKGGAVREAYLLILSREPTAEELKVVAEYATREGANRRAAAMDVIWALLNSKEFLYRH